MIYGYAQGLMVGQRATAQLTAVGAEGVLMATRRRLRGGRLIEKSARSHSISEDAVGSSPANVRTCGIPWPRPPTAAKRLQMGSVKTRHTAPEMVVRRAIHACGLRFRLHRRDLPGRPDIVLSRHRIAVFVHGCFWHGCVMCDRGLRRPKSNVAFWSAKLDENRCRDDRNIEALKGLGWHIAVIWECETRNPETLAGALDRLRILMPSMGHYDD
jgi:DNA mismatch endonuclease (patch repair protein)